jgi:hypothetical protein
MSEYDYEPEYPDEAWQTKDIVYTAVMGVIMLAALLEWFLWLVCNVPQFTHQWMLTNNHRPLSCTA